MNLKDTYNRIAEDWHKDHQDDSWWVEGTNTFIALFPNGATILDVGCGGGFKSKYIAAHGLVVTGIDFSDKLLEIAKREVPGVDFEVMDMRDVTKLGKSFDGIFAQASLLHIPRDEVEATLEKFVSALKTNGYLYVAVKGAQADKPLEEIKAEYDYGYSYERFFSYFTMDELEQYFKELGLEIVYKNSNVVGKTEWIQVIGKK